MLLEGGNAVDAAVAAVLTSFVAESPLTGFGAGGFMLVHTASDDVLIDFFVGVPGLGEVERRSELVPVVVKFGDAEQVFNIGAASCGTPGTGAGLWEALRRFGTVPAAELTAPAARLAREGVVVNEQQAYLHELLTGVLTEFPEARALYAPDGNLLGAGDVFRFDELGDALDRYGRAGPDAFYRGDVAEKIAEWVVERGGTLSTADLAAYEPAQREPVRAALAGRDILTNPPPSAGGILIAFTLGVLELAGRTDLEAIVLAMEEAQAVRTEQFNQGLYEEGFAGRLLAEERLREAADRVRAGVRVGRPGTDGPADRLGSTTHISTLDADGNCASVTCSNGTGSGIVVPGTGVHVNNMLGEEDLNPLGFHRLPTGVRLPSMMAPSVVLRDGEVEMVLGSGGSNRIRSAIVQAIVHLIADEDWAQDAVSSPRVHFEGGIVQAEPGLDEEALEGLEELGYEVARWRSQDWFFGGVHAVARDPETGALGGGGDPRRGGSVALV
ncbi:MAG: gamma-glutamyltranspeptidase / glutathione hydrolase [Solirubrobacterales bacterium]|nr:gamma-glutamyltranspeptidase / glutathione hydrolase [Solirubrobacterales bacterium]